METPYPSLYMSSSDWSCSSTEWTRDENKKFESALAIYGEHEPDRWQKVAAMIPGKTIFDVIKQYRELAEDVSDIEAGRVPIPGYLTSSFSLEVIDNNGFDDAYRKRPLITAKSIDQGRKKGVPWTEDEHRRFLIGLLKHGKGDWRNISRNFVVSKTPTQVASHAQKYFMRQQLSGVKDKRRPSIHDITTLNLTDTSIPSDGNKPPPSLDKPIVLSPQQKQKVLIDWNCSRDGSVILFDSNRGNLFVPSAYEVASSGLKLHQGPNLYTSSGNNLAFRMPSVGYQIRG